MRWSWTLLLPAVLLPACDVFYLDYRRLPYDLNARELTFSADGREVYARSDQLHSMLWSNRDWDLITLAPRGAVMVRSGESFFIPIQGTPCRVEQCDRANLDVDGCASPRSLNLDLSASTSLEGIGASQDGALLSLHYDVYPSGTSRWQVADARDGGMICDFPGASDLALIPGGELAAVAFWDSASPGDSRVELFALSDCSSRGVLLGEPGLATLRASPDGTRLAIDFVENSVVPDRRLILVSLPDGTPLATRSPAGFVLNDVPPLAWSADGRHLVAAEDGLRLTVLSVPELVPQETIEHAAAEDGSRFTSAAFSPDASRLVATFSRRDFGELRAWSLDLPP